MKKYRSIAIFKALISRHILFRRAVKRNLIIAAIPIVGVIAGAFATIYVQHQSITSLSQENTALSQEKTVLNRENTALSREKIVLNHQLTQFNSVNSKLTGTIDRYTRQFENIDRELGRIEQQSEVETGVLEPALEKRIRIIGEFYAAKEREYSVIGNRLERIEALTGLDETAIMYDVGLLEHVESARLTAHQEHIFHNSIPGGFPGEYEVITSQFGMRKHPVTKVNAFHKGIDIRAREGDPVYATADGLVHMADHMGLYGNGITILHNFGFETRYAHLSRMLVEPGDAVHKGQLIGYSGNTGRSNGPHLHYEVRYLGKALDPLDFLNREAGNQDIFTRIKGVNWQSLISLVNRQFAHQTLRLSSLEHTPAAEQIPGMVYRFEEVRAR